ncbi:hypothetical protein D3C85_1771440 [compost metagenome]
MENTEDGYFRHPQFDCWRDDKPVEECIVEDWVVPAKDVAAIGEAYNERIGKA